MIGNKELLAAVVDRPKDTLAKLAYSDWLSDRSEAILARAFMWAARNGKHPSKDGEFLYWFSDFTDGHAKPCNLPDVLISAMKGWTAMYRSNTLEDAFAALAYGLDNLDYILNRSSLS